MYLELDPTLAAGYKNPSQIARVVTEHWAADNLFCLACSSDELTSLPNNARVEDYHCPNCSAKYQLEEQERTLWPKGAELGLRTHMMRAPALA